MEEKNTIKIEFNSDEIQLYNILQQHCMDKKISLSDYIKELIKTDLAWGHFRRRKKTDAGEATL